MAAIDDIQAGQIADDGPREVFLAAAQAVQDAVDLAEDLAENVADRFKDRFKTFGFGSKKRYPLHNASSCKDLRNTLMEKIDHDEVNKEGNAPIHCLVIKPAKGKRQQKQKIDLLVTLLTFGNLKIEMKNGEGYTALHLAVRMGDAQLTKVLIAFGANINTLSSSGHTPFNLLQGPHLSRINSLFTELGAQRSWDFETGAISPTDREGSPPHKKLRTFNSVLAADVEQCSASSACPRMVDEVTKILVSAGAERRPLPATGQKRILASPTFSRAIFLAARTVKKQNHEPPEKRYKYYYELHRIIKMRFSNIADNQLHHSPEKSAYLLEHMKEARLIQMAGSKILFLDGGGMRGLIQIEILSQLEERTGKRVTELFDWIVGTSAGGLIALGLVYGGKTLAEMRQFCFKLREDVFMDPQGGVSFDTPAIENILEDLFGDKRMSDVEHPKVVVTATYKKTINLKLHLFSNAFDDTRKNEYVRNVARYTSAAPIYFKELDDYVDGGILASNPSSVGITAIQKHFDSKNQKLPISLVVSIGSGVDPDKEIGDINATDVLSFDIKGWFKAVGQLTDRIKSLSSLLSNAITESEVVSENCRFRCSEQGITYYRLNPKMDTDIPPGETDLTTLIDMIMKARCYTVDSLEFNKLILSFEKVEACRKCLSASYSEKTQKLLSSYKRDLK